MSISFDGALEVMSLDVQDLIGLTTEEIQEKVETALPELSASELESFMEDLRTRLSEIEDELHELMDGYEEDIDEAEDNDSTESAARYESRLEECQEALDAIDEIEDAALDAIEHEQLLNVETDQDYSLAYDTTELNQINNGDVMNITCLAGSQSGIFGEETTDTESTATDLNGDGFLSYDEINAASVTESFEGQDVFFQINSGDKVSLISSSDGYASFQVTTKDGKTFTVNIEGDANIYFTGADYLDSATLSSWPEELLKRCYDNKDTTSFYGHVYEETISDNERLSAIEGYDDVSSSNTLASVWAEPYLSANQHNIDNGTIKSSAQALPYYESAIEQLYGFIDGTLTDAGSISEVWANIFQEWTAAGLNSFDFSTLIANIVMGVSLGGDLLTFQSFFAPVIDTLEGYFESSATEGNKKSTLEKLVITLLETQSGEVGLYGGTSVWSTAYSADGTTDGVFTDNDENLEVIEMYKSFIPQTGWAVLSGTEDTTYANEEKLVEASDEPENQPAATATDLSDVESLFNNWEGGFLDFASSYIDIYDQGSNGISEENLEACLKELVGKIQALENPTVGDVQNTIYNYVNGLEDGSWKDDVGALFMVMLHDKARELFDQLSTSDFKTKMWDIIDNGGDVPPSVAGVNSDYKGLADYWDLSYDKQDVGEALGDVAAGVGEFFTDLF